MKRGGSEPFVSGIDLLEESIHTLRRASPATLLCYYAGAIPFILAALFFWADMSHSGLAEEHLIPGTLLLAALFAWMKLWQSAFAMKLAAEIAHEPSATASFHVWMRALASQTLLHSTAFLTIPISAVVLLPLGWVFAFYQNVTAFGLREPELRALTQRSWHQAKVAPRQNHIALLVLALFSMFVFFNLVVALLAIPFLLKTLLGIETPFTLSAGTVFNTTFLAVVLGLTYLCLDPIIKAMFVLRCFHGEARATGEDLRVTLRALSKAAACMAALALFASPLHAAPAPPAVPAQADATELNRSIDEVLKRREYAWRSPREKVERQVRETPTFIKRVREWLRETAKKTLQWIADQLRKLFRPRGAVGGGSFALSPHGFVYLLIGAALLIVGILLWILWRSRSRVAVEEAQAAPAAPVPDLESDEVTGEELPVDGWTQLALELLARGELRLAMRAFYFSSLAHLAERNLVTLARFKSNRDYERELQRRSHALPELASAFAENVNVFDRVWYGLHDINAELLQRFRGNVERIRAC
jgi:hypothetical protein